MFFCALRPTGEPLGKADLFGYIARLRAAGQGPVDSLITGPFAALVVDNGDGANRATLGRAGDLAGVGVARLDDPGAARALARVPLAANASDLELVLAALDGAGEEAVLQLLGDFSLVAWDARAHKLLAVRDALGVKTLYHRSAPGLQLFASHVGPLHLDDEYDKGFIADFLLGQPDPGTATIWKNVRAVAPGTYLRIRGTQAATRRYWDPADFIANEDVPVTEAATRFRHLLSEAVARRTTDDGRTWAQLSGGLDSSSVVCTAARSGTALGGTLTIVDTMAGGDERRFSDQVVGATGLRNEQITDMAPWQDDGDAPPETDEPSLLYPFWARDRRMARVLEGAGARAVLSGFGADHYLTGNLHYIADMVAHGQIGGATRELAAWATTRRQSFWRLLTSHVLAPSLPAAVQARMGAAKAPPEWVTSELESRERLADRLRTAHVLNAPAGHHYAAAQLQHLADVPRGIMTSAVALPAETRFPFLHRPLVEFSLSLPARLHARPGQSKWILREAMRGVLPEAIRTRQGKGMIDARVLSALQREAGMLDRLLREPLLADLGCVETRRLREAVEARRRGVPGNTVFLMSALALETWMSVRSGRWERMTLAPATAA